MFDFERVGVYPNSNRRNNGAFVKVKYIGEETISFVNPRIIDNQFKKINVIVLIQQDNRVITEDKILPHVVLAERDVNSVLGRPTNDAIVEEAARRAAFNAGITIAKDSLRLIGMTESNEVYYVYTGVVGKYLSRNVEFTNISALTQDAFLGQCSLKDFR